jgi:hypothetical protein
MAVTTTARPLDRRREKAAQAGAAAAQARSAVTDLDHQLDTVRNLAEQQKQRLRQALDETARLKRSIKAAAKRRDELVKQRKKAVAKADQARGKAAVAETKYDKEVLADLVRREKEKNRSAAPERNAAADGDAANGDGAAGKELQPAQARVLAVPARRAPARTEDAPAGTVARPARRAAATDPPPDKSNQGTQEAARPSRRTAATDPPPEQVNEGTQTARRTAARKTAKAARLIR